MIRYIEYEWICFMVLVESARFCTSISLEVYVYTHVMS